MTLNFDLEKLAIHIVYGAHVKIYEFLTYRTSSKDMPEFRLNKLDYRAFLGLIISSLRK
jgi:hypothetical protein